MPHLLNLLTFEILKTSAPEAVMETHFEVSSSKKLWRGNGTSRMFADFKLLSLRSIIYKPKRLKQAVWLSRVWTQGVLKVYFKWIPNVKKPTVILSPTNKNVRVTTGMIDVFKSRQFTCALETCCFNCDKGYLYPTYYVAKAHWRQIISWPIRYKMM